jgi:hypothetical protein
LVEYNENVPFACVSKAYICCSFRECCTR